MIPSNVSPWQIKLNNVNESAFFFFFYQKKPGLFYKLKYQNKLSEQKLHILPAFCHLNLKHSSIYHSKKQTNKQKN